MKRCPITYQEISDQQNYSAEGLKKISRELTHLEIFPYDAAEQRQEAQLRFVKMSIQGVQPKISARVNIKASSFEITDTGGLYILKPQTLDYQNLPENEDLSMKLASTVGIEVPFHGLLLSKDGSYTYFIKRMDRAPHNDKLPMEDFAQLSGLSRHTKYNSTMEKVVVLVEKYCSVPLVEKQNLFIRILFNYLIGNEDMHLKNFSLISREGLHTLSPAYDFLNTTIAMRNAREEIALPLNGKKSNLKAKDLLVYFPKERLGLNQKSIDLIVKKFQDVFPEWNKLIEISFLTGELKEKYFSLLQKRKNILNL